MASSIVGTLSVKHLIDPNGCLSLDIPLQLPPAKVAPRLSLAYHSASNSASTVAIGWVLRGAAVIERVPATIAQDGFRGVVNYDTNDRFALDGQRLVYIGGNEYRSEIEQWSKFTVEGDPTSPTSWTEYLPNGSVRTFGNTNDSNIGAVGQSATRVWAVSRVADPFSNYMDFSYTSDTATGSFYVAQIDYGGNQTLAMAHQRQITFEYVTRSDIFTKYIGGSIITVDKHLSSVSSFVNDELVHTHVLTYDTAPLTGASRLTQLTLTDASGASVRPLRFDWIDGSPSVFEQPGDDSALEFTGGDVNMLPIDVNATGRSDVVVASKVTVKNVLKTRIATHLSDATGRLASQPSAVLETLPYHVALIPLDMNGDGQTDLVHISLSGRTFTVTVLLSTSDGYVAQPSKTFQPESTAGHFRSGDFEGTGRVGLIYIYQVGSTNIKFVQFVSDGTNFTALSAASGPSSVTLKNTRIVVGDLNGDGSDDVFLLSPKTKNTKKYPYVSLLQSQNGVLQYKPDDVLAAAGESIPWTDTMLFLPYSVDEDSKTSILVASKLSGKLALNLLRANGRTLLPSPQEIVTSIPYNGNLTITRASSTNSLDIVNTFSMPGATPPQTRISILRYNNGAFNELQDVRQGPSFKDSTWGDFRGIGRSDLLLNTQVQGKFNVKPMRCASVQPVDFISGYTNGMEARVDVSYAPLSDRTIYDVDSGVSNIPLAATNAMARNVSSVANLSDSSVTDSAGRSRTEIVYFPSWVVKQVGSTPYAPRPDVQEQTNYTYRNARFSFDGRGWLGFEIVAKSTQVLGCVESTWYSQTFPFLSQAAKTEAKTTDGVMLQTRDYKFQDVLVPSSGGKSHFVGLASVDEVYYECGLRAYCVNASYEHDDYGNLIDCTIVSPESGTPAVKISSSFDNLTSSNWVIGCKTSESISQSGQSLKEVQIAYFANTRVPKMTKRLVGDGVWSTETVTVDEAGNEVDIQGPGQAHREFTFDETKSFMASLTTHISASAAPLVETASYSLANGKPLSFSDANGNGKSYTYDVLGRVQDTYQQDLVTGTTLIKKDSFLLQNGGVRHVSETRTVWGEDLWYKTVDHIDVLQHVWRTERPSPDDPSLIIYTDTEFDAAGRQVSHSRGYLVGDTPASTTYEYDERSRVIKQISPPPSLDLPSTLTTLQYSFASGLALCVTTHDAGGVVKMKSTQTRYLPNADRPSHKNLVKPFVVSSEDELGQRVERSFDALGRLVLVKDPSDVRLNLSWDGLGRIVERRVSQVAGDSRKDISHSSMAYDDAHSQSTLQNVLTGAATITQFDFVKRPISMTCPDEKLMRYVYDEGSTYSKGRLMSVSSESTGVQYSFDYDLHGNLAKNAMSIDGEIFTTTYDWSPLNQLISIVNPDRTVLTRVLCANGSSLSSAELTDAETTAKATVALSGYGNVFDRPLVCDFGNRISSVSDMHTNGVVASLTMSKDEQAINQQQWSIDAFSQINQYQLDHMGVQTANRLFSYDLSGQLGSVTVDDPSVDDTTPEEYTYDASGNLAVKGGKTFVDDGWQLLNITDSNNNIESTYIYSVDGNMLSKTDASENPTRTMEYDSQGRLISLDDQRMVYDYVGRLVKRVQGNGDTTIYPTHFYELDIVSGKKTHTSYLVQGYRRASLTRKEGQSAVVHYFHVDHLGSTVAVSDGEGGIVTQYTYDAFGQITIAGDDLARYKFSGKELIGGLYYFGARFYDPEIGRFLTLDNYPINIANLSPSTFNFYVFSRNNPINFIDANGNVAWWHVLFEVCALAIGVAVLFIPGVNAIAVAVISGALIGAAFSAVNADINHAGEGEFWEEAGIGAAFGAITGFASAGLDAVLPAAEFSIDSMGTYAATTAARGVGQITIMKAGEVVQTLADNGLHGRAAAEGLSSVNPFSGDEPWYAFLEEGAMLAIPPLSDSLSTHISDSLGDKWSDRIGPKWSKELRIAGPENAVDRSLSRAATRLRNAWKEMNGSTTLRNVERNLTGNPIYDRLPESNLFTDGMELNIMDIHL